MYTILHVLANTYISLHIMNVYSLLYTYDNTYDIYLCLHGILTYF